MVMTILENFYMEKFRNSYLF